MGETVDRFPLFPLGIVLLPSEVVPLHIFEERYKKMIGECLESDTEFGIVWLSDDGLREVGCTARVTQVLAEMDDGRMNILVAGGRAFTLVRRIDDMAYPAGEVVMLDDEVDADDDAEAEAEVAELELASEAHERYADLVEQVTDERPSADDLEDLDAYGMAATIEFDAGSKQELLELRSERERLAYVRDLFSTTMKRIAQSEEAGELARSNGRIHIP
jgi:Lon protease-like protein